jgi:hypothetical protein
MRSLKRIIKREALFICYLLTFFVFTRKKRNSQARDHHLLPEPLLNSLGWGKDRFGKDQTHLKELGPKKADFQNQTPLD